MIKWNKWFTGPGKLCLEPVRNFMFHLFLVGWGCLNLPWDDSKSLPPPLYKHTTAPGLVTSETQTHTCLLVHKLIVVGEEGSELCGSVGEDFEDVWQEASLEGNTEFSRLMMVFYNGRACTSFVPLTRLPPWAPLRHREGLFCQEPDSDWFSPVCCRRSTVCFPSSTSLEHRQTTGETPAPTIWQLRVTRRNFLGKKWTSFRQLTSCVKSDGRQSLKTKLLAITVSCAK